MGVLKAPVAATTAAAVAVFLINSRRVSPPAIGLVFLASINRHWFIIACCESLIYATGPSIQNTLHPCECFTLAGKALSSMGIGRAQRPENSTRTTMWSFSTLQPLRL